MLNRKYKFGIVKKTSLKDSTNFGNYRVVIEEEFEKLYKVWYLEKLSGKANFDFDYLNREHGLLVKEEVKEIHERTFGLLGRLNMWLGRPFKNGGKIV